MGFESIIGQDHVVKQLKRSIVSGEVNHALLFLGQESVGKRMTAIAYAKALNCLDENSRKEGDFCDNCRSCQLISLMQHPDVRLLTPETTGDKTVISIDAIRAKSGEAPPHPLPLREDVALKPLEGRTKVYIIDPANRPGLQEEAGNALLLTLEEPPKNVVIILISSRPNYVLPTLVSRCHPIKFNLIRTDKILTKVMEESEDEVEAKIISSIANGKLGFALDMAKNPHLLALRKELTNEIFRLTPVETGAAITLGAITRDIASRVELYERENESADRKVRRNLPIVFDMILSIWRDLLVLKEEGSNKHILNIDLTDEMEELARKYSTEKIYAAMDAVNRTKRYIERNSNIDLTLENMWSDIL